MKPPLSRREGAGSIPLRREEAEALSGAGMCRCGSGWAICHQPCRHGPQAGATPAPRARLEESLTSSSDAPGSGRGWSREALLAVQEVQTWGPPPEGISQPPGLGICRCLRKCSILSWKSHWCDMRVGREQPAGTRGKGSSPPATVSPTHAGVTVPSCVQARGLLSSQRDSKAQELDTGQDVTDDSMDSDISRGHCPRDRPLGGSCRGLFAVEGIDLLCSRCPQGPLGTSCL